MAGKTFRGLTNRLFHLESLPPGGGGVSYLHTQAVPSLTWTIVHGLAYRPAITMYDTDGILLEGEVDSSVVGTTTVTFTTAVAGRASLV